MTKKGCPTCNTTTRWNLVANPSYVDPPKPVILPELVQSCKEVCTPIIKVEVPKYAFKYPNFDRLKLATIKDSIHHPRMPAVPTLRRIDRDDQLCKLADEHVRTSIECGKPFYERSTDPKVEIPEGLETVIRKQAPHPSSYDPHLVIVCPEIKEGRQPPRNFSGDPTGSRVKVEFIRNPTKPKQFEPRGYPIEEWRDFLDQDPADRYIAPPEAPLSSDQHWVGYGVVYQKLDHGDPTRKPREKWRRALRGYHNLEGRGQRPIPSDKLDIFRRQALGRGNCWWPPRVSSEPWKSNHYYFDNTDPMQHLTSGPRSAPFEFDCRRTTRVVYDRGLHTTN